MPLVDGCKHEIEIEIGSEEVQGATQHVLTSVQKKARLPGFRPGKVPLNLIRTKFREEIRQEVVEHLLPKAFRAKADAEQWKVVGTPTITEVHFNEGEPLRFKAEFEVAPEFELGEFRGLEVPYAQPEVAEEDVDKRVEEIRERKAEYVNEDPRPLVDGDYAVVAIRSIAGVEGEPVKSDNMTLHLGDPETLPEFTENLRGLSPGDHKEISVSYPEDYGQERLAGKTVTFDVAVNSLRRKELPELNDEFARDLGDYQNLSELRDAIRSSIRSEREYAAQQEAKNKLVDQLVDSHEFPIPQAYLDRQIEMQVERRLRELAGQGIDPRQLKLDWNKIKEAQKEGASRDVKASLLLERIADAESIQVTNEELDREVQRIAKQEREPVAATRARLDKDGTLARLAGRIRTEKVLNFLFENARKVTPTEQPAESTLAE
ncbi:MAG TPA: trigger factor [Bryobacteraceae bacterium]|nr:trigger factor [Bryobacteraceae bacterium]